MGWPPRLAYSSATIPLWTCGRTLWEANNRFLGAYPIEIIAKLMGHSYVRTIVLYHR